MDAAAEDGRVAKGDGEPRWQRLRVESLRERLERCCLEATKERRGRCVKGAGLVGSARVDMKLRECSVRIDEGDRKRARLESERPRPTPLESRRVVLIRGNSGEPSLAQSYCEQVHGTGSCSNGLETTG
mgnify:CR=1 FL=1